MHIIHVPYFLILQILRILVFVFYFIFHSHKIRWCRTRLEMKPRINIAINHITIHDTWRCVLQRRNNALYVKLDNINLLLYLILCLNDSTVVNSIFDTL